MNSNKNVWIALVVIGIIAIIGTFTPGGQSMVKSFGGTTNYDELDATAIKIGGSSGSRVGPIIASTCALLGFDTTQAASSTAPYDCAVTGVVSGDVVIALSASTSQRALNGAWWITGAKASTTAGYITVGVFNGSNSSQVPSTAAAAGSTIGSSTPFLILHPLTSVPGL